MNNTPNSKIFSLVLLTGLLLSFWTLGGQNSLFVQVSNIDVFSAPLRIAVYDNETDFMEAGKMVLNKSFDIEHPGEQQFEVGPLNFGEYAIAIYLDVNGNQRMDKNILGIPKEPFGFSNNFRAKWGAPDFREVKFKFSKENQLLHIRINRWKNL